LKRIKLKDPSGMFRDPATGQTVIKGEEADLIEPVGRLTQDWLNAGGLLLVNPDKKPLAPKLPPAEDGNVTDEGSALLDSDVTASPPPPQAPEAKSEEKKPGRLSGMLRRKKAPAKKAPAKKSAAKK